MIAKGILSGHVDKFVVIVRLAVLRIAGSKKDSARRLRIQARMSSPNQSESPVTATAKVIAFANQKGGVAKTTTTLNLAVAFAEEGHRVLCADMDPQGNLTMSQGIDPDSLERSMYDVLVHHTPIKEVIQTREVDVACVART